jgi:hypothetical protein
MKHENFSQTPAPTESKTFPPLPAGTYEVQVTDVKEMRSDKAGDFWNLTMEVKKGEYTGRRIFDSMFFVEDAKSRRKLILDCLGINVAGDVSYSEADLIGRKCRVTIEIESRTRNGATTSRNKVTYTGYAKV